MLTKTLVFYFFIPEDYETNIAIKLHIECLKRYCHIFNKAIFYIACNKTEEKYIDEVKNFLFNLKDWEDIKIKVVGNDIFCEAHEFKNEIIERLDEFKEEVVFFAHTKGVINIKTYPNNVKNILKWIYLCYFQSLEFEREAIKELVFGYRLFYGSLLMEDEKSNGAFYAGTFYWLNPSAIYNRTINGQRLPVMSTRDYAEMFPSYFLFNKGDGFLMSHFNRFLFNTDLYRRNFDDLIDFFGEAELYYKKYNDIMKNIR